MCEQQQVFLQTTRRTGFYQHTTASPISTRLSKIVSLNVHLHHHDTGKHRLMLFITSVRFNATEKGIVSEHT